MARVSLISTLPLIVSLEQHRGDWTEVSKWSAERAHACANYYPHSINSFFFLSPFLILLPTVMCIIKRVFFSLFSHMCVYVCVNIYRRRKIWRVPSQRQNAACCCCLHKNRFFFLSLGCVCRVFFIRSRRFLLHIYSIISLISYRLFLEKQWEIGVASNF